MANISKIKRELASRHLNDSARGKDKERAILSGFLDRIQLNPVNYEDQEERPDFLISFGDGELSVGIELTVMNTDGPRSQGSPERWLHSQWKKVAVSLSSRLSTEPKPLPNVYGSVFFREPSATVLNDLDVDQFCEEVTAILRTAQLSEAGSQITGFDPAETPLVSRVVDHLFVQVFPSESGLLWWCSDLQSGLVPLPDEAIKAAIKEKQVKARTYNWGASQQRWLLIYAAGEGLADHAVHLEDPGISEPYPFTHIFVWDKWSETIYCVSPAFVVVLERGRVLYLAHVPEAIRPYVRRSELGI